MLRRTNPRTPDGKLTALPLAATLFFVVSGGPNGLEDIVRQSGPGACLLLLIITPLVWSLPCALMAAELTSAIPEEGGYYVWVSRAFGPFWGFTCAWWSWMANWFDVALYPVLVVSLLKQAGLVGWTAHVPGGDFLLSLAVIVPFVALNVIGVRSVGRGSLALGALVMVPFLALAVIGFAHPLSHAQLPGHMTFFNPNQGLWGSLGLGLSVCMWNYLGWDNLSTVASEVEDPQKSYPRAIALTLPVIVAIYVVVVAAALAIFPDWRGYETGIWVRIGQVAGGAPLFFAILLAGIASSLGQFNGMLLCVSRVPFVLAEDGYLPKALTWLHPKFGTPVVAILFVAALDLLFSLKTFSDLVELEVLFYGASIVLELGALVALRKIQPELQRPYRIPWGNAGLFLVCVPPIVLIGALYFTTLGHLEPFKLTFLVLGVIAPIGFFLFRSKRQKTS
jgi:amino acid transporter